MTKYLTVVLIFCVNLLQFNSAMGPGDPVDLSFDMHLNDEDMIGRNNALDRLLEEHIELLVTENGDLRDIIKKSKILLEESENVGVHQYYVELLELIQKEGSMSVLQPERERLLLIMESVGKGAEFDHSLMKRNIIGAFADAEAKHIFNALPDIGMRDFSNFEVPDLTSSKFKKSPEIKPGEPTGEQLREMERESEENIKSGQTDPEVPKGDQDKGTSEDFDVSSDVEKQPKTPDGESEGDAVGADEQFDTASQEKLPETPIGDGGDEVKGKILVDKSKDPETPIGKTHDEM